MKRTLNDFIDSMNLSFEQLVMINTSYITVCLNLQGLLVNSKEDRLRTLHELVNWEGTPKFAKEILLVLHGKIIADGSGGVAMILCGIATMLLKDMFNQPIRVTHEGEKMMVESLY